MAVIGGPRAAFNGAPLIGGGLAGGVAIGGAMLAGIMNYRRACAEHQRRQGTWEGWDSPTRGHGLDYLESRQRREIDRSRTLEETNRALRIENERLRAAGPLAIARSLRH